MGKTESRFHLSLGTRDLSICKKFYIDLLGLKLLRESQADLHIDFFGHHLVFYLGAEPQLSSNSNSRPPFPHFGIILDHRHWHSLLEILKNIGIRLSSPVKRNLDSESEQYVFFFEDFEKNSIEVKYYTDDSVELA